VPWTARCWKHVTSVLLVIVADLAGLVPDHALCMVCMQTCRPGRVCNAGSKPQTTSEGSAASMHPKQQRF
jgi:hypothetical protein